MVVILTGSLLSVGSINYQARRMTTFPLYCLETRHMKVDDGRSAKEKETELSGRY